MNLSEAVSAVLRNPTFFVADSVAAVEAPVVVNHDDLIVLSTLDLLVDPAKTALKLHKQFGHPSAARLAKALKSSDLLDVEVQKKVVSELERIEKSCEICGDRVRRDAKPKHTLPLAEKLNDVLAVDLTDWSDGKETYKVLHMIDLATRYSCAAFVKNKVSSNIVNCFVRCWISYSGRQSS